MVESRRIGWLLGSFVGLSLSGLLHATNPGSGTINTPASDELGTKQTLTFAAGPFVAGSLAGTQTRDTVAICTQSVTPPGICDSFAVNLNLPDGYWSTRRGTLTASVKWADQPDGNDLDLYIVDEQGRIVASSSNDNSVTATETASFTNPGTGVRTYRVIVVNWLSPSPIQSAAGTVTFSLVSRTPTTLPPEPTPPASAPRFFDYKPPSGLGENAGEPTLGVNFASGNVMFIALLETLRASFDDSSSPARVNWTNKSFLATANRTNDPILFTDSATGRTFVSQLIFPSKQSLSAFTNDDGESWQLSQGSGINSGVDHQTIGGGVMPSGLTAIDPAYRNAVYYAAQDIATAEFAMSVDGGRTYGPAIPMYAINDCAGIHGHIKVSPADGSVYVPLGSCQPLVSVTAASGQQAAAISRDGGLTWSLSRVPGSKASTWDPAVAVARGGVVYFGFGDDGDRVPRVAVSRDRGATWTVGPDMGAAHGIKRIAFPAMVAGDDGRAAMAFLGTRNDGEALGSGSEFEGTWSLYVSTTYDGGATWVTVNATPTDPVQRGNVCDAGINCPGSPNTRNLLDFMDIQIDARGRILVGYADGCVTAACIAGADKNGDGFIDARDNDAEDKAAIARQGGGLGLLAEFDPPVPAAPAPPQLAATLQGPWAFLAWSTPDDGGAPISGYRVYKNNTAVATLGADVNTWSDSGSSATTAYRVSAINLKGEGVRSPAAFPSVPLSGCALPGMLAAEDQIDHAPNAPPQPQLDVKALYAAEPFGSAGAGMLHFTVATGGGALPPNSQWYIMWQRTTPDATHDRNYVAMRTNLLGAPTFDYGRISYPLSTGSPGVNQGNIPTRLGMTTGSYDAAGTIRISIPTTAVDGVGAAATLLGLEVRTFLGRNDMLPVNQNLASDFSPAGSYTLVGNASCKQPPEAPTGLTATARQRQVELKWSDNSSDETGFLIERSTSANDGYVEVGSVGPNASGFVDQLVVKKSTYFYRVRAANGSSRSAYTNPASARVK